MATYREKRGTNTVPVVSSAPTSGVNGEIVYITGEGLASYNGGTWSRLTANVVVQYWQGSSAGIIFNGLAGGSYNTKNIQSISLSSDTNGTAVGTHSSDGFEHAVSDSEQSTSKLWYASLNGTATNPIANSYNYTMTSGGTTINSGGSLNGTMKNNAFGRGSTDKLFILGRGIYDNSACTQVQTVAYASASTATLSSYTHIAPGTDGAYNSGQRGYGGTGVSATHLYTFGSLLGQNSPPNAGTADRTNQTKIAKFSQSNDANSTLQTGLARYIYSQPSCISGTAKIFIAGGIDNVTSNNRLTTIDAYNYAADTDMTEHGDLFADGDGRRGQNQGVSSTTHGYSCGGYKDDGFSNHILKFSDTTTGTASDIGDLPTTGWAAASGQH
tara:strand:- start:119 stop:1273 length:1155 start_codon:yes stop_codon:yes gene_type:complete